MRRADDDAPIAQRQPGRGSNSVVVRRFNERLILSAMRRLGELSRAEIARHTTLSPNTVGLIIDDLLQAGLVREAGRREGERGQPATLLELISEGAFSIGVKMGRSSVIAVLVDFCGHVCHAVVRERPLPGPAAAIEETLTVLAEVRGAVPRRARARLAGLGLAIPYDLDSWRRELDLPGDHLTAWSGFDFPAALAARIDLPLVSENDGTAVAVAELFRGHGRRLDDFVSLHFGSALGGGIVLGGRARSGWNGNAGDVGLMPTDRSRILPRPTGAFEILLARCSVRSLVRHLCENGVASTTSVDLDDAISRNPILVGEWIEDAASALAEPLLTIGAVLDVQAVILDGDIPAPLISRLIDRLRTLAAETVPEACRPPELLQGTTGRHAAAIGAAILPLHTMFSPDRRSLLGAAA